MEIQKKRKIAPPKISEMEIGKYNEKQENQQLVDENKKNKIKHLDEPTSHAAVVVVRRL